MTDTVSTTAFPHVAYVSVGSNMGDKIGFCREGIGKLERSGHSVITGRSRFYRTAPVHVTDQDWFVNAAVKLRTDLSPQELLADLLAIEQEAGRDRSGQRFGPRTLDLDLILYDDQIISTTDLTLPHPRMQERRFVLAPLCDIDAAVVHPVLKQPLSSLLEALDAPEQDVFPLEGEPGGIFETGKSECSNC